MTATKTQSLLSPSAYAAIGEPPPSLDIRRPPCQSKKLGLNTGSTGALNEMRVCIDLMSRRIHVFRAVSPACPCDLVAINQAGLEPLRIEVKTGYRHNGVLRSSSPISNAYDVLAVVTENEIVYMMPQHGKKPQSVHRDENLTKASPETWWSKGSRDYRR